MSNPKTRDKELKENSTMAVKRAYDYIRDMTIDFSVRPGEQINEIEVASNLKMSRVPVREALNRLVMGSFVTFDPGKGFFCRKFSESEMKDLYGVRFDLEMGAVRQACQSGNDDEIFSILTEWQKIADTYLNIRKEELIFLDELFHIRIATLCGNMERVAFLQNIYERIRFVRRIHIEKDSRRNALVEEHLRLIQAILKHDEVLSAELLEHHLGVNSQELKENIRTGMLRIYASEIT
ncbi:GntR family transcriptional regulator [Clostridium aminobutyricum]|uniref:GntR family transcriptional regulator n=1 Tax=Clostridium aminobutyricum TaxID=33953 RepID=A0A939DA90_CLOAM|nr:GntR family transcriptional regulator [Clostridium aminobutyricum]MBN7774274.1 GntR family transcriptional regulator [Clostridium aminobutyricum]